MTGLLEMPLEEALVDRHCLDRHDPLIGHELLDPVDEEHRVAMRQRRHHLLDVKPGGAAPVVSEVTGPGTLLLLLLLLLRKRRDADGGELLIERASTSFVTSSACERARVAYHIEGKVCAAGGPSPG
jgi:hypothetical protein